MLATFNTLPLLAANLGYSAVDLSTEQPDLLLKLQDLSGATATAGAGSSAAAASGEWDVDMAADSPPVCAGPMQQQQQSPAAGRKKRSSAEAELPNSTHPAKLAANGQAGASSAAAAVATGGGSAASKLPEGPPARLRLRLGSEEAQEQRQILQQRKEALQGQQQQQQDMQQQRQQLKQQQLRVEGQLEFLELLCSGDGLDVVLPVAQGSGRTRCMGVTLQLDVADLKELADAR